MLSVISSILGVKLEIDQKDLDFIGKISSWIWGIAIILFGALCWIIKKVYSASKFILQVEDHNKKIESIIQKVDTIEKTVENNKNYTETKLDYILDFIRSNEEKRAEYAEHREMTEAERIKQEKERHEEIMRSITDLKYNVKLAEDRRKLTHSLLEKTNIKIKEVDKKHDDLKDGINKTNNKVDTTISFVEGKFGISLK